MTLPGPCATLAFRSSEASKRRWSANACVYCYGASQPVVVCPARGIDNMRIPRDWRPALDDGRLLVLSPFPATARRPTAELAAHRNNLVADIAQRVFIAHAAPGSKTEAFAHKLIESGKPLLTLDSPANTSLVEMGAEVVETEQNPKEQYTIEGLRRDNSLYS